MKTIIKKGIAVFVTAVMLTGIITVAQPGVQQRQNPRFPKQKQRFVQERRCSLSLAEQKK